MKKKSRKNIGYVLLLPLLLFLSIAIAVSCGGGGGDGGSTPSSGGGGGGQSSPIIVTNSGNNSLTSYGGTANGNTSPTKTVLGGLYKPWGVALDTVNNEIFVTHEGYISVYSRTADGRVIPLRTIKGSSTGLQGPQGIAADPVNNEIIVANRGNGSLTVYSKTASGNAPPIRAIAGASTGLSCPEAVSIDTVNNELVVVNSGCASTNYSVTVYDRTASGNAAPLRTISGASTGLSLPFGVSVDTVNNEIIVANSGGSYSITVYDRIASGNVAPIRTISGSSTGLNIPAGVAVDTTNNEVIVATFGSNNSIRIYSRTAGGNVSPIRTISGSSTGLDYPWGIAVDTANNEIIVANVSDGFNSSVTVYSKTANGDVAPIRTIKPALSAPTGIAFDTKNNEIFVANTGNFITVFQRAANGDITPLRTITGSSTGLDYPWGIAVDTVNNEIIVVNNNVLSDFYSITVYDRTASGNAAPKRTITGSSTGLDYPWGIAVDTVNNEIIVVNNNYFSAFYSITVYDRTASGNAAPKRTISGSSTGLSSPYGIAIDTANNEIFVANDVLTTFDSVTVYDRTASGNAAPKRTISGLSTGLYSPKSLVVDTANNVILVVNNAGSITVYNRTASGNTAPLRTILGSSTGLDAPWGIALLP